MLPDLDQLFGKIAIEQRFISRQQFDECQTIYETVTKLGVKRSLQDILVDKGYLTNIEVLEILRGLVKEGVRPRLGNFEIISKIGEGGMGAVYKARQLSLDRTVALKVLPPRLAKDSTFVRRFVREAKTAGKLAHPNIITTLDVGESGGFNYIALEYIEGPTVGELIEKGGKIPEKKAMEIVAGIAAGLAYAARHNIIHRDIKPSNIMIAADGKAKLCDLGLAKQLFADDASLTESGAAVGTPHYMSPEQAQGKADIDGRSDIYSLGATLFHMVTGRQPFVGDTPLEILHLRLRESPPSPRSLNPDLSDGVCAIVQKMMARDLNERYQTAEDLLMDVQALRQDLAAPPAPRAMPPVRGKRVSQELAAQQRLRRTMIGLGVGAGTTVIVVVIVLLAWLSYHRRHEAAAVAVQPDTPAQRRSSATVSPPPVPSAPPAPAPAVPAGKTPQQAAPPQTAAANPVFDPEAQTRRAAQGQSAEKAYLNAIEYESRNPKDIRGRIQRWELVMQVGPSSNFAAIAKSHLGEAREALRTAPSAEFEAGVEKAELLAKEERFGEAARMLQSLDPKKEPGGADLKKELDAQAASWRTKAVQKVNRLHTEAQNLVALGRYADARTTMSGGANIGFQDLSDKVQAEIAEIGRLESAKKVDGQQAKMTLYQALSDQVQSYLDRLDFAGAAAHCDKLLADANNQSVRHLLAADRAAAPILGQFYKAAEEGAKQFEGKELSISGIKSTLEQVDGGTLVISAGAGSYSKKIKDLRPDEICFLAANSSLKAIAEDPFKRGIFFLYTRNYARAKMDLAAVTKDKEKVAPYSERLDLMTMASRCAEAAHLFDQAKRLSAAEKHKEAVPLFAKIAQEYGNTLWATEKKDALLASSLFARLRANQAEEMVVIPPGRFIYGKNEEMMLPGFSMDKYEVSNADYALFLEYLKASGDKSFCDKHEPPNKDHTPEYWNDKGLNQPDLPVVGVDWYDACAFAKCVGKRLPSETEWERAARGTKGFNYPWSDDTGDAKRWVHSGPGSPFTGLAPVSSLPGGKASSGCFHMLGNVEEWTDSWIEEPSADSSAEGRRVVRGGSWQSPPDKDLRGHDGYRPTKRTKYIGFRCAK